MKTYVMTSGAIFGLISLVHIWRVFEEGARPRRYVFGAWTLLRALRRA